jgi:hypothetical protein
LWLHDRKLLTLHLEEPTDLKIYSIKAPPWSTCLKHDISSFLSFFLFSFFLFFLFLFFFFGRAQYYSEFFTVLYIVVLHGTVHNVGDFTKCSATFFLSMLHISKSIANSFFLQLKMFHCSLKPFLLCEQ